MSDNKHCDQEKIDQKQLFSNSSKNGQNDGIDQISNEESASSVGNSSEKEDTPKKLAPRMKKIIQEEFKNILLEIQKELQEFVTFVEDIQEKTPSEWELITVSPLGTPPKTSSKSSNDDSLRDLKTVDSRPSNAPVRDAFQIVRNLLSKTAILIDKVASTTAVSDDSHIDTSSPQYTIYYADYVFQIACFVLHMIGEHFNKFGRTLGETSMKETLDKLHDVDDNIGGPNQNVFLHRKGPNSCTVKSFENERVPNSRMAQNNMETIKEGLTHMSENRLKNRISEALELMNLASERMLSALQETESTDFDLGKEPKENFTKKKGVRINTKEDFSTSEFSILLKEELRKNLSNYSKEFSEKSQNLDTSSILKLFIQSFREAIDSDEESSRFDDFPFPNEVGSSRDADVEDNVDDDIEKCSHGKLSDADEEKDERLDDLLDVFVDETYRFAVLALSETEKKDFADAIFSQIVRKSETEPIPIIALDEKIALLPKTKSSSELQDRTGIREIKECPSCPRISQFKMSDVIDDDSLHFSKVKKGPQKQVDSCGEECLQGKVLHENHDKLPPGKMEVRQVNKSGRVVISLEEWSESDISRELIKCTALMDIRQGKSRTDTTQDKHKESILKTLTSNISSSRKMETANLSQRSSHSALIPIKTIGVRTHVKASPDIYKIIDKMWDLGESLSDAGYGSGPPLVESPSRPNACAAACRVTPNVVSLYLNTAVYRLKLCYENVYEEAFKTLVIPSGIPLSYYQKVLFHIYESSKESEVEDFTDEIFPVLGEEIFIAKKDELFVQPTDDSIFVYPNPASTLLLQKFRFTGIILALAIVQNNCLRVKLPLCFYKCLLDRPLTLHDLKEIDPVLHQKLVWLNENDISQRKAMFFFTIQEKMVKQTLITELIANGKQVSVTENNKMLFIEKCLKWKLLERCRVQFMELIKGFNSVLEPRFLDKFSVEEIQKIIENCPCLSKSEINCENDS